MDKQDRSSDFVVGLLTDDANGFDVAVLNKWTGKAVACFTHEAASAVLLAHYDWQQAQNEV
jgi:hypothetical protein